MVLVFVNVVCIGTWFSPYFPLCVDIEKQFCAKINMRNLIVTKPDYNSFVKKNVTPTAVSESLTTVTVYNREVVSGGDYFTCIILLFGMPDLEYFSLLIGYSYLFRTRSSHCVDIDRRIFDELLLRLFSYIYTIKRNTHICNDDRNLWS